MKKYSIFDLTAFRQRFDLSQERLAAIFGMSTIQIWRYEQKGQVPTVWLFALKYLETQLVTPPTVVVPEPAL